MNPCSFHQPFWIPPVNLARNDEINQFLRSSQPGKPGNMRQKRAAEAPTFLRINENNSVDLRAYTRQKSYHNRNKALSRYPSVLPFQLPFRPLRLRKNEAHWMLIITATERGWKGTALPFPKRRANNVRIR